MSAPERRTSRRWAAAGAAILAASLLVSDVAPATDDGPGPANDGGPVPADGVRIARLFPSREAGAGRAPNQSLIRPRRRFRIPRAFGDRPDRVPRPHVHVVYLVPADMPDLRLDRWAVIEDSIRSVNKWMKGQSRMAWRLDMFRTRPRAKRKGKWRKIRRKVTAVDVTFVRARRPQSRLGDLGAVASELAARGLSAPGKRYLAYVESNAGGVCGEAEYPVSNNSNQVGQYSAIYLRSDAGCRSRDFAPSKWQPSWTEATVQQEMLHNDGVVPLVAPRDCKIGPGTFGHVCTPGLSLTSFDPEQADVMFPFVSGPLAAKVLDRNRDDYLDHGLGYRDLRRSPFLKWA